MKSTIVSGFFAALATVSLPLLICGMGKNAPVSSPAPASAATPQETIAPSAPTPSARTIREIIVHHSDPNAAESQAEQPSGDSSQTGIRYRGRECGNHDAPRLSHRRFNGRNARIL